MRVIANAALRSWTLLAAFGGSYALGINYASLRQTFFQTSTLILDIQIIFVTIAKVLFFNIINI